MPLTKEQIVRELKRRGQDVSSLVLSPQARENYEEELKRCALDPVYWCSTYAQTYDPRLPNPYLPFQLYPRQEDLMRWLEARQAQQRGGCVEKSKDMGVTWVVCAFMLHRWLFDTGFAGGLGSRKLEYIDSLGDSKSLFEKIRMLLRKLPYWQQPQGFQWKQHSFECKLFNPANGASITGEGGDQIGRGGRTSVYIVDEYNYLERPELADASLRDNSNVVIYVGTPNGMVGIANKKAVLDLDDLFTFHWKDDPRKNHWTADKLSGNGPHAPQTAVYPWYEEQKLKHQDEPWIVRQEIDIDYLGSGHPRFDREFLSQLLSQLKNPIRTEIPGPTAWAGTVKTWKDPEYGRRYLIVSDVAEGESDSRGDPDFSCSHVYDTETWEQVCTYRGRPDTHSYAVDLAALGEMYNFADVCIERTGPGLSTITSLAEEFGYPCVWASASGSDGSTKLGFVATTRSKSESEAELASFIADMKAGHPGFIWNDRNTVNELLHFVVGVNGRSAAENGWHDDEVTCCKMASVVLPQVTTRRQIQQLAPPKPRVFYGAISRR